MSSTKYSSFEELKQFIKSHYLQKVFFDDYFDYEDYLDLNDELTEQEFEDFKKDFEMVESVCNSDELYSVAYFKDLNVYICLTGTYDSYGAGDHEYDEDITQVYPKEVSVITYVNHIPED